MTLAEAVTGWRVGDRVIVTATSGCDARGNRAGTSDRMAFTEERTIARHRRHEAHARPAARRTTTWASGDYRGEVANLSRNVVVESADPDGVRGHTMYHRDSAGSISYAEFRHLGKEGVLGRYSLHFHLVGDTMRGSSVVGASIWDSGNRWITIHGTNYLVVRDCVGYQSVGHGFFLEDGTEVYNVLDRNLAVQALRAASRCPSRSCRSTATTGPASGGPTAATRSRATSPARATATASASRRRQPAASTLTLPRPAARRHAASRSTSARCRSSASRTTRSHCDGLYGFNLGEGVDRVGPDARHPFVVRNMKIWEIHYAFRPQVAVAPGRGHARSTRRPSIN